MTRLHGKLDAHLKTLNIGKRHGGQGEKYKVTYDALQVFIFKCFTRLDVGGEDH